MRRRNFSWAMDTDCLRRLRRRAKSHAANGRSGKFVWRFDGGPISTTHEHRRIQPNIAEEGIACGAKIRGVGGTFCSRCFGGNAIEVILWRKWLPRNL